MQFLIKVLVSALIIAGVATLARRYTIAAALLASLPLTSLLAIIWLYADTRDTGQVAALTYSIFWAVIPSLLFFITLPLFLRVLSFVPALLAACAVTMAGYGIYILVLGRFDIRF
ncbi:MAG: DUF3147 family protein [Gammaproteobacteria bacterium]